MICSYSFYRSFLGILFTLLIATSSTSDEDANDLIAPEIQIIVMLNPLCWFQDSPGSGGWDFFSSMEGSGEPFSKCLNERKSFWFTAA